MNLAALDGSQVVILPEAFLVDLSPVKLLDLAKVPVWYSSSGANGVAGDKSPSISSGEFAAFFVL